jgi:glycosyltransferase involved in cell wall biosynthesis
VNEPRTSSILIIAYEFPPSAGGGVQRVLKLARYLPSTGWLPTVLTARPVSSRPNDATLVAEVSGVRVLALPHRNATAFVASLIAPLKLLRARQATSEPASEPSGPGSPAAVAPLSTRIVRRFMLDGASLWSRSVPAAAKRLHAEIGFDAVYATGPPHSALVAGRRVAAELGLPFVVDLRDPWSANPGYRWPGSAGRDATSLAAEAEVLHAADLVLAVSDPIAEQATAAGARRVVVIPNGFDPLDLPAWRPSAGPLRIAFMGRLYATTDPTPFLDALALVKTRGSAGHSVHLEIVGQVAGPPMNAVASRGLTDSVTVHGFRPHAEALEVVARADAGLVIIADQPGAESIYSGKLFEYLGMGVPVLLCGPTTGVAASLVREANAGAVVAYRDVEAIADALDGLALAKSRGETAPVADAGVVARFDRRVQAARIGELLSEIVQAHHG